MAINYPNSLDNFTNPTSASPINSPSHSEQHSNANDAIEALEAKVGSNNSVVTTSHDYKISQLESLVTSSVAGAKSIYQDVRNQSGSAFTKATPIYVSGSEGASGKMLISAASNASEAVSSKTMGITVSAISNNSNGQVISEGILEGIDTTGAADGDPVWLGVNGAKIYGLVNKPSAPAHLVFLGIVIRGGQANTGSMYVKIQNGFELKEIHDVAISSPINGNILAYDSATDLWKNTNTLQSTSSTVPLVIKRVTSQTSNLQEWQDQSGGMLAFFNKDGALTFNSSSSIGGTLNVFTSYAGNTGVIIRGFTSQTANLQEWQNSAGGVDTAVTSTGRLSVRTTLANAGLNVGAPSAATVAAIIRGAASQTANLQEWQNSAGTVLNGVNAVGQIFTGSTSAILGGFAGNSTTAATGNGTTATITTTGAHGLSIGDFITVAGVTPTGYNGTFYITAVPTSTQISYANATTGAQTISGTVTFAPQVSITPRSARTAGLVIRGAASQSNSLQQWQNSSGTVLASINNGGSLTLANSGANGIGGLSAGVMWYIVSGSSGYRPLVVQAATSQTGDLTAWQNSSGTVVTRVSSDARIFSTQTITAGNANDAPAALNAFPQSASSVGLVVKGLASQTGNLQEWQSSSGTVLVSVQANGYIQGSYVNLTSGGGILSSSSNQLYANSGSWLIVIPGPTKNGLIIQAAASQTANLQEWQDSTGAVIAKLDPAGGFTTGTPATTNIKLDATAAGAKLHFGTPATFNNYATLGTYSSVFNIEANARSILATVTNSTTTTTLIVKANTSQTADLQQWQNSAGTVLSSVSAEGLIRVNNTNTDAMITSTGNSTYDAFRFRNAGGLVLWGAGGNNNIFMANSGSFSINGGNWSGGRFNVDTGTASTVGITVRGSASQTANLQEWQSADGSAQLRMTDYGKLFSNYLQSSYGILTGNATYAGGYNFISSPSFATADTSIIVKAVTSQTGALQQWQLSSGTVAASISAYGDLIIPGSRVAIGSASLGGNTMLLAVAATASYVPIVVRGVTSQSADLQQWQNSLGGVVAKVDSNAIFNSLNAGSGESSYSSIIIGGRWIRNEQRSGLTRFGVSTGEWHMATNPDNSAIAITDSQVGVFATSTTLPLFTVKGMESQTANLQEWQNSAGSVLASISASGGFTIPSLTVSGDFTVNGTTTNINTTNLIVEDKNITIADVTTPTDTTADGAGITIKGATDKTLNWVQSTGSFTSSEPFIINNTSTTKIPLIVKGYESQTSDHLEIQNSSGLALFTVKSTSGNALTSSEIFVKPAGTGGRATIGANIQYGGFAMTVNAGQSLYFGTLGGGSSLEVVTSDSYNRYKVQGTGTGIAPIFTTDGLDTDVNMHIYAKGAGKIGINTTSPTAYVHIKTPSATVTPLTVQATDSQTANIFEVQNSSAASLFVINGGSFSGSGSVSVGNTALAGTTFGSQLYVQNNNAARVGVTIKATASQTADLQQWQNSAGTVLAQVDSSGKGSFNSVASAGSVSVLGDIIASYGTYLGGGIAGSYIGAALSVIPWATTVAGVIVRGRASQSANLQEWQNSSGTALASISPSGAFSAVTKSFVIKHPTKEGKLLRYGSLEGPENGVYVRGKIDSSNVIELPDYWIALIDESTITVNMTPIGSSQNLYVEDIKDNKVYVSGGIDSKFFYTVFAERKDVTKLVVEE